MPTLESLEAKRASLRAQAEQHVGQVNRINGAISLLDDLIAEWKAEEAEREVAAEWRRLEEEASAESEHYIGGIDRSPSPYWNNYVNSAEAATSHDAPPVAPPEEPYIPTGNMTPPAPFRAGDSDAA